jgi:benzoyl-CoA reductase subunit B
MENAKKKKTINRLKSMYVLRAKVDEVYMRSMTAMKAGEPTVWAMLDFYYGDPILRAMDIETVYPENYSAAVAAVGAAPQYLEYSDAEGFPTHLCGYSRVNLGYAALMMKEFKGKIPVGAPMGGMPKPLFLLSSSAICDARYKWFQALGRYMDVPVWAIEAPVPGTKELFVGDSYNQAVKMGTKNLQEFVKFVERISERKMDWAKLEETVDTMIELNRVWYETNLLRKVRPCPMHSRDFFSAMPAALFVMGDLKDSLKCFKDLHEEVETRVKNGIGAIQEEKYRMVFAELPPWHSLGMFDQLAERGWNFVIESFGYHPPEPLDLSGINDPLERISRFNLQYFISKYEKAIKENLLVGQVAYAYFEYARDWQCDGALLHPLISCRSASTHLPYVADMLMERLNVPSLIIEGDIVDLRLFDLEGALAKAEAFEETMDYYKSIRGEK